MNREIDRERERVNGELRIVRRVKRKREIEIDALT
jgi:hypothetical protein